MVDASDFVDIDEGTFDVRLLVMTVLGSLVTTFYGMAWGVADEIGYWSRQLLLSPLDALAALFERVLMIPANLTEAANQTAADFIMGLEPIGPFAWVVAIVLTFATLVAANEAIARMGLI